MNRTYVRGKQKFQCPYCTSKFSQKHNLKMHVKQKHDENFETTDFRNIFRIDEYKEENQGETLQVEQSTRTIKENPSKVQSNEESEPSNESITEDKEKTSDDSRVESPNFLSKKKISNTSTRFQCSYCDSNYAQKTNLYTHVKQKHEENFDDWKLASNLNCLSNKESAKAFQCSYCDCNYAQKTNLYTHVKQKHKEHFDAWKLANNLNSSSNKESAKAFQCPYCESKYSQKCNMKTHVKLKHDEKFESTDFSKISSIDTHTMSEKKEDLNSDDSLNPESLNRKRKSTEISSENVKKSRRISNAPKKFADFEMGNEENQPPTTEENMFEPDQENSNAPKDLVYPHQNREMGGPTNQNFVTVMKVMSEDDL